LKDLDENKRIILKRILKKQGGRALIAFIWFIRELVASSLNNNGNFLEEVRNCWFVKDSASCS
jgi:hypothetical protein